MAEEVELLVTKGAARVVETSAERVATNMTEDVRRMYEEWEEGSHAGQVQVRSTGSDFINSIRILIFFLALRLSRFHAINPGASGNE